MLSMNIIYIWIEAYYRLAHAALYWNCRHCRHFWYWHNNRPWLILGLVFLSWYCMLTALSIGVWLVIILPLLQPNQTDLVIALTHAMYTTRKRDILVSQRLKSPLQSNLSVIRLVQYCSKTILGTTVRSNCQSFSKSVKRCDHYRVNR